MKAKKNDIVYYAHEWNECNSAVVEEIVITSWGKKRAQAKYVHNGEMIANHLWLDDGDHDQVFATREEADAYNMAELFEGLSNKVQRLVDRINTDLSWGRKPHANTLEVLNDFLENGVYSIDYAEECKRRGWR